MSWQKGRSVNGDTHRPLGEGERGGGGVALRMEVGFGGTGVQAEARFGRVLLDDEEPAGITGGSAASGLRLGEVEAEERDVGFERASEQRITLLCAELRVG